MLCVLKQSWRETVIAVLKVATLVSVAIAFVSHLQSYRSPIPEVVPRVIHSSHSKVRDRVEWVSKTPKKPSQFTTVMMQTLGVTAVLGVVALVSQFICRRLQHITTVIFFGVVALFMV